MPNEVSIHAQEYGLGGSFFEEELFATDEDEEDEAHDHMRRIEGMQKDYLRNHRGV